MTEEDIDRENIGWEVNDPTRILERRIGCSAKRKEGIASTWACPGVLRNKKAGRIDQINRRIRILAISYTGYFGMSRRNRVERKRLFEDSGL